MQGKYIVALDQGTTSSRTVVLDQDVMSVCRAGSPQGGVGCGRGVPWREGGSKRDRGTEGSQRGKRTMAVRIGRTGEAKGKTVRPVQMRAG